MTRRRFFSLLAVLTMLFSTVFFAAQPAQAATGLNALETFSASADYGNGIGVLDRTNPTSIQARLSAPTTVTVPSTNTDGHDTTGVYPTEGAFVAQVLHVKNFCPTAGVVYGRLEADPQVGSFVVWDQCNTAGSKLVYSQPLTDTTWRTRYVEDSALYDPFHSGWDDQKQQDDETIDVRMALTSGCMSAQIYDMTDDQWDEVYNRCGSYSHPTGNDYSYWFFSMGYGGLDAWGNTGDLGDYGNLAIRNMQRLVSGTWTNLTSKDGELRFPINNWALSGGIGPFTHPVLNERWQYEWSSGTGYGGGAIDMLLCDAENADGINNGDQCDYTLYHRDYTGTENLNLHSDDPHTTINIQRNPTANDVYRATNTTFANNRTYIFKSNSWGNESTLFVDVTNMQPTVKTDITGQGYVLRSGGGGLAPTCSWVTTYKYSCTSASGSPLEEVYVKVKTKASPVTATGLSFNAGNGTRNWTWSGFSFP